MGGMATPDCLSREGSPVPEYDSPLQGPSHHINIHTSHQNHAGLKASQSAPGSPKPGRAFSSYRNLDSLTSFSSETFPKRDELNLKLDSGDFSGSVSTVIIGAPPQKPSSGTGTVIAMGGQQHLMPAQVYTTSVSPNASPRGQQVSSNTMTLNGSDGAKSVILSNPVPGNNFDS